MIDDLLVYVKQIQYHSRYDHWMEYQTLCLMDIWLGDILRNSWTATIGKW